MTIEPINTVMTYQAQNTQQAKPIPTQSVSNAEFDQPTENIALDQTTVKVNKADAKDNQGAGTNTGEEYSTKEQAKTNSEQIKKAVENLNKNMDHSEAVFGIHEETNRVTIKIVDKETKEVIKELPPEKTLDMIAKAWELAGILVDERR